MDIGRVLVEQAYISQEDLDRAAALAAERGAPVQELLLERGAITRPLLGQAVAEYLKVPYADLQSRAPTPEMVRRIPEETARKFTVVLFSETDDEAVVATDESDHTGMTAALRGVLGGKRLVRAYALADDVRALFIHYRKPLAGRLAEAASGTDLPAPKLVDEVMRDALALGASDIHIEPRAEGLVVRFRIDGVLHEAARLDREHHLAVLNRIKVLSRMRLDDHASAQDGAIRYAVDGTPVDVRVSIVPTVDGEKTVMRLLTGAMRSLGLTDLGLGNRHWQMLEAAVKKPFGMILVTGPTGSGKTTTLYAVIKTVNQVGTNITTVEDPVEYRISGVNQIQVNQATGLTFGQGLRAIVRQNPDVILVGEIRDRDTAEIAVNSALTGHMLFSTFHANDAATAVPRLLEIGIEPFLLSSTLELVVSQRLVRRICESCRIAVPHTKTAIRKILPGAERMFGEKAQLYHGKGCAVCAGIGYRGRIGLFEMIPVSRDLRELILRRPSSQEVWKLARAEGATSLFEDGIEKVKSGQTTLEEVARVAGPGQ